MTDRILEIEAVDFGREVLEADRVVVDFYSTECPPCEALAPKYDGLSEIYGDDIKFVKIFRQGNRELAEELGVSASPTVLFYQDGQPRETRLIGGIRRSQLMSELDTMLPAERVGELRNRIAPRTIECDAIVLGGGPAGLTAGIYLAQAHVDTILVDTALPGGYVATTHQVSNYPGFAEPQKGFMLSHFMGEQAKAAGVTFRAAAEITSVDLHTKTVVLDGHETIRAKRIVLATGSSPRPLGIPGEKEYRGRGISYCATCDAKYYEGRDVVVIGGGNSAIEESLFISRFARQVTIVHQFAELQANREAQEQAFANDRIEFVFEHEPRAFVRNGDMDMEVVVEDLKTGERRPIRGHGVFVFVGFLPNVEGFGGDLDRDQWGYLRCDEEMRTNIDGVYAVGDLRSKAYRQITTATADGTIAAIAISKELA